MLSIGPIILSCFLCSSSNLNLVELNRQLLIKKKRLWYVRILPQHTFLPTVQKVLNYKCYLFENSSMIQCIIIFLCTKWYWNQFISKGFMKLRISMRVLKPTCHTLPHITVYTYIIHTYNNLSEAHIDFQYKCVLYETWVWVMLLVVVPPITFFKCSTSRYVHDAQLPC